MNIAAKSNFDSANNPRVLQMYDAQTYINQLESISYKRNQYIYRENHSIEKVYFIESGQVLLSEINDDGREVIKTILRQGEVFGEQALVSGNTRSERARIKMDAVLRVVNVGQLKKQMTTNGLFALYFNQLIINKLTNSEQRWKSQVSSVARNRIIDFILELVEKDGRKVGFEHLVYNSLTHLEMANYLGTSRQTVTVVLNELREKNLIYFDRKRLLVRDIEKLKIEKNA